MLKVFILEILIGFTKEVADIELSKDFINRISSLQDDLQINCCMEDSVEIMAECKENKIMMIIEEVMEFIMDKSLDEENDLGFSVNICREIGMAKQGNIFEYNCISTVEPEIRISYENYEDLLFRYDDGDCEVELYDKYICDDEEYMESEQEYQNEQQELRDLYIYLQKEKEDAQKSINNQSYAKAFSTYVSMVAHIKESIESIDVESSWVVLADIYELISNITEEKLIFKMKIDGKGMARTVYYKLFSDTQDTFYLEKATILAEGILDDPDEKTPLRYVERNKEELENIVTCIGNYDILENDEGKVMFCFKSDNIPKGNGGLPILFYDGGKHAILFKDPDHAIVCDYINSGVRDKILKRDFILFCEYDNIEDLDNFDEEDDERVYIVQVVEYTATTVLAELFMQGMVEN